MRPLKFFISAALLSVASLCFSQNMAFLSRNKVLGQINGYTGQAKAFDSLKTAYQREIESMKKGIDDKFAKLTAAYKPMDSEDLPALKQRMNTIDQEKMKLLEDENKLMESRITGYNSILDQKYKTGLAAYIEKLNAAIEGYAKEKKLDVVWDTDTLGSAAAWLNKAKDITAAITEKLK